MLNNPTGDWNALHDKYYRKTELHTMSWSEKDLSKLIIAIAPFGGPIATIRNEKKIVSITQSIKPVLHMYSSYGDIIHQFQWDKGKLIGMGWMKDERLACVLEFGAIRVYDFHGHFVQISLGEEAKEAGVRDAQFWDSGVVILTNSLKFVVISDLSELRPKVLADPRLQDVPTSWTILPPSQSLSSHIEVFISTGNTVLVVDSHTVQDQNLTFGPLTRMTISPDGKFISLFTEEGKLIVMSSDFQKTFAELRTNSSVPPLQLSWCGSDAVLLHWEDTVLVVGPTGDWIKFSYEGTVHIQSEIDCARIISSDKCEILERLSSVTENVFKIGSTAPSAILYDAQRLFEKQNPKAYESIQSIRPYLEQAVDDCIDAAGKEFNPTLQKALMKAASFGKGFLDGHSPNHFVDIAQSIRVLNAIRHPSVGIPLTFQQYSVLSPEGVIEKLLRRGNHLLAKKICEYLDLPLDTVLIHWASSKVSKSTEDEDSICRQVVEKMSTVPGISFAQVANTAYANGRVRLATKLLDYEPSSGDQVPLLLSMQEDEVALLKAIESNNSDLVYLVLLHMKRKLSLADFFRLVNGKSLACTLLIAYCREQDPQLLRDFFYQSDRKSESAYLLLSEPRLSGTSESGNESDVKARISVLQSVSKLFHESRDASFEGVATEDQIKLLKHQLILERDFAQVFLDLSVTDTILKCLILGHKTRALDIKRDLSVSEKRFAWLELTALIKTESWELLERFSKASKHKLGSGSNAGYMCVIDALMRAGHGFQAQKLVETVTKPGSTQAKELTEYVEQWQQSLLRSSKSASSSGGAGTVGNENASDPVSR